MKQLFFLSLIAWFFFGCDKSDGFYRPDFSPTVRITMAGAGKAYGAELMPLDAANTWMYQRIISEQTGGNHPGIEYIRMKPLAERKIYTDTAWVIANQGASITVESYIKVDDTGIWYYGNHLQTQPSPVPWVLFPARVGMKWDVKDDSVNGGFYSCEIEAEETVATPAGSFTTLRIRAGFHQIWLSPGIGIVKRVDMSNSVEYGQYLLRSYTIPAYNGESSVEVEP